MTANAANVPAHRREIVLKEDEYKALYKLIRDQFGIDLHPAKKDLIPRRLNKRLLQFGMSSYSEYISHLRTNWADEVEFFANAITTNLTSFFREAHHFDYLDKTILPEFVRNKTMQKRLRIWSAACSTGEEPYSLSIILHQNKELLAGIDVKILATDIDTNVLQRAHTGVYSADRVATVPKNYVSESFKELPGDKYAVRDELKSMIAFRKLNFFGQWPMKGNFDIIVCRNALIYFDAEKQKMVVDGFSKHQVPGDYLIVGHSESVEQVSDDYELIGKSIYQKL